MSNAMPVMPGAVATAVGRAGWSIDDVKKTDLGKKASPRYRFTWMLTKPGSTPKAVRSLTLDSDETGAFSGGARYSDSGQAHEVADDAALMELILLP